MTGRPAAKTATCRGGQKVVVGDTVRAVRHGSDIVVGPVVTIVEIYRQGYDGTILRTEPAPEYDYPHHFSRAARDCVKVNRWTVPASALRERFTVLVDARRKHFETLEQANRFVDRFHKKTGVILGIEKSKAR